MRIHPRTCLQCLLFSEFFRSNIFTSKLVCVSRFLSRFFWRLVRQVQIFSRIILFDNIHIISKILRLILFFSRFDNTNQHWFIIDGHRIMWIWIDFTAAVFFHGWQIMKGFICRIKSIWFKIKINSIFFFLYL